MTIPSELFRVGMRYAVIHRAEMIRIPGKGLYQDRFPPGAFDASLGRTVPFTIKGRQLGHARVIAAEVAGDGLSVEFTYEITDLDQNLDQNLDQAG